jgi:hypothetical protein
MASTMTASSTQSFDLGQVIRAGFRLIARRPATIILLALVLAYLPAVAEVWASSTLGALRPKLGDPDYWPGFWRSMGMLQALSFVVGGVNWMFQGGVALCAVEDDMAPDSAISRLPGRAPALFVTSLVSNACIALATLALIVPGLLLGLAWCAGPAVTAVENKGLIQALRRSAELTRGHRGRIFGLLLLFGVVRVVTLYGVRLALATPKPFLPNSGANYLIYGVQPVISAVMSLLYAAMLAEVYVQLQRLHDGASTGTLAATFD